MEISEEQKKNMESFLEEKKSIVSKGEMKEQHFLRMEELGFGNGGVVLKVQHNPTGITMARKVCSNLSHMNYQGGGGEVGGAGVGITSCQPVMNMLWTDYYLCKKEYYYKE